MIGPRTDAGVTPSGETPMKQTLPFATLGILSLAAVGAASIGCAPDYASRATVGHPCSSNAECPGQLICVASMCVVPDSWDAGVTDVDHDVPPGTDVPLPDVPPRPDGAACQPLERMCRDAQTELICSEDGSGWVGRVCPDTSRCVDGSCQFEPDVCDSGAMRCLGNEIQACRDGQNWTTIDACPPGTTCGPGQECVPIGDCDPGMVRCRGQEIQYCNGNGWEVVDVCPPDMMCADGGCVGVERCDPGELRCFGRDIQRCDDRGTWQYRSTCDDDTVCIEGGCSGEAIANLTLGDFWVEPGEYWAGDLTYGELSVSNTGTASIDFSICTTWLSPDPQLDFNRDYLVMDLPLTPLGPGDEMGFGVDVPLEVPPGSYWVFVECNLFESDVPESSYDDNIAMSPEPLMVIDEQQQCYEDEFEYGPQPAPIEPGEYWLGLCDAMDEFTFWVDDPSGNAEVAFEFYSETPRPFGVAIYNEQGEYWGGDEVYGSSAFTLSLMPGRYIIEVTAYDDMGFNYGMMLSFNSGGDRRDLAATYLDVWIDSADPSGMGYANYGVANVGRGRIDPTVGALLISRDQVYQPEQDAPVAFWDIHALDRGEEIGQEGNFALSDLEPGEWTFIYVADYYNEVRESNERNNVAVGPTMNIGPRPECGDYLDPNETLDTAVDLEPDTYGDLLVCTGDMDHYRFCPDSRERLDISLFFEHSRGDIDINLYDDRGQQLTGSYGVSNSEYVTITAQEGRCYIAEVYLCCGGDINSYVLAASVSPPSAACGVLEPNDDFDTAAPIEEALGRDDLAICPATDVDLYLVRTSPGERLLVRSSGVNGEAELALSSLNSSGTLVSATSGINPGVAFPATDDGIMYIKVEGINGRDMVPYRLTMQEY